MKTFVSAVVYRRYLSLLSISGIKLPDTVMLNIEDKPTEYTVLHCIELNTINKPKLELSSWAIVPDDISLGDMLSSVPELNTIYPEKEWHENQIFWFGKIERVYKDTYPVSDKKLSGFGWCGNVERDLAFPTFCLPFASPLFTFDMPVSTLELFNLPAKVATKMGSIDDTASDPVFMPLTVPTAAELEAKRLRYERMEKFIPPAISPLDEEKKQTAKSSMVSTFLKRYFGANTDRQKADQIAQAALNGYAMRLHQQGGSGC